MGGLRPRTQYKVEQPKYKRPQKPAKGLLVGPLERMVVIGGWDRWMGGGWAGRGGQAGIGGWDGQVLGDQRCKREVRVFRAGSFQLRRNAYMHAQPNVTEISCIILSNLSV
jgi:hypothetical protein